jgi:spermidine/putrescine transport system ATP-binding protein
VYGKVDVDVGIRPEKIRIQHEGTPPDGHNHLGGKVVDASYIGVSTQYLVETRSGARVLVYEQNIERTVHGSLFKPGEEVQLSWSPDHTFVVAAPSATEDAAPAMDPVAIQEEPVA